MKKIIFLLLAFILTNQTVMAEQNTKAMLPDISVIGNMAGAYYSQEPIDGEPEKTGFNLSEIEMAIQSIIDPYFKGDLFLAFSTEGAEIEEGYITTLSLPKGLQVRAGKLKLPFGRQNQTHPHSWSFVDNALITKKLLGTEGLNEIGLEVSYLFPTPFFLQLQTNITNGDNDLNFSSNNKNDFLYESRLSASIDIFKNTTLLFGTSGAWGNNNSGDDELTSIYGGDFLFKWAPKAYRSLKWQTEILHRKLNTPFTTNHDTGFYSYLDYQFVKRWHGAIRYDESGFHSDKLTKEFRVSPALTFTPTEFSLLRLQYNYDKTLNRDPVHAVFLQMQYSMGPHGAHNF